MGFTAQSVSHLVAHNVLCSLLIVRPILGAKKDHHADRHHQQGYVCGKKIHRTEQKRVNKQRALN